MANEMLSDFERLNAKHNNLEAIMLTQMQLITEISALADRGDLAGIKAKVRETARRIGQATSNAA